MLLELRAFVVPQRRQWRTSCCWSFRRYVDLRLQFSTTMKCYTVVGRLADHKICLSRLFVCQDFAATLVCRLSSGRGEREAELLGRGGRACSESKHCARAVTAHSLPLLSALRKEICISSQWTVSSYESMFGTLLLRNVSTKASCEKLEPSGIIVSVQLYSCICTALYTEYQCRHYAAKGSSQVASHFQNGATHNSVRAQALCTWRLVPLEQFFGEMPSTRLLTVGRWCCMPYMYFISCVCGWRLKTIFSVSMENCHGNDVFCRGPECAGTVRKSNGNLLGVNCNMQSACFW